MSPQDIFEAVLLEYNANIAISVVSIHAVHLAEKIKDSDIAERGKFSKRFENKARENVLWRLSDSEFELVTKINNALHVFDMCRQLGPSGLGGCRVKTLQEVVAEQNQEQGESRIEIERSRSC
jgi:hypothetical protein